MMIMTWGRTVVSLCKQYVCNRRRDEELLRPNAVISFFRHLLTVLCGVALVAFACMSELS